MPLPQPLHIFRKDLTHLWPETLAVLALFAAFAWSAPSGWTQSPYAGAAQVLALFLHILMPVAWIVLISRLIHDESLVGDRQFWTSRPYHWAKLLAAKLLYLVVFLYLPFLLMQVFLLRRAGLYPTTAIPDLLYNLLLLTVIVIVPITAIAAVTATFARVLLAVLGAIFYLLILAGILGWINWTLLTPPYVTQVLIALLVLIPGLVLIFQYATRRTTIARIALLATPAVLAVLLLLTPATALVRKAYPLAKAKADPTLGEMPEQFRPKSAQPGLLRTLRNEVQVVIPFSVADADKESNYLVDGTSVSVQAGSIHWTSPYTVGAGAQFNSGTPIAASTVAIPLYIFNQIRTLPADVHLSLAVTHFKADPPATWKSSLKPFAVPGHGLCSFATDNPDLPPVCRYAFKSPELNFLIAPLADSCTAPSAPPIPGRTSLGSRGSTLDFDPVVTVPIVFPAARDPRQHPMLCPGAPLTFIEAKRVGKVRFETDSRQLILDDYAVRVTPQASEQQEPNARQ